MWARLEAGLCLAGFQTGPHSADRTTTAKTMLIIATRDVIAGADGWEQVAEYDRRKEAF